jgi:AcrR family transcriptional regulator
VPGATKAAEAQGIARRRAIVAAARDLIAARGVHGARLADVAAVAGVTRQGLLHHFAGKDALLHAVLDDHERTTEAALREALEGLRGLDAVAGLAVIARLDVADRTRAALWSTLLADAAASDATLRERLLAASHGFIAGVEQRLADAQADGDIDPGVDRHREAVLVIAGINGLENVWLLDERVPLVDLTEAFLARTVERLRVSGSS